MTKNRIVDALKKNTMLIALVFVFIVFELLINILGKSGSMFSASNIAGLISQNGYIVILAVGMLLCIIAGGNIDLSVGSIVALVGAFAGKLMVSGNVPIPLTIIICAVIGIAIGSWQGFWIAYMRIPAFIVTLAGMLMFRGFSQLVMNSETINGIPDKFNQLFGGSIDVRFFFGGGDSAHAAEYDKWYDGLSATKVAVTPGVGTGFLSLSVIIAVVLCAILIWRGIASRSANVKAGNNVPSFAWFAAKLAVICAIVLYVSYLLGSQNGIPLVLILLAVLIIAYSYYTKNTVPGRRLYAMGGNEKAAKLSGIDTNKILFFSYANMGFLSAIAAMVCVARQGSVSTSLGQGFELDAIGACFIGGASAYGGTGKVSGAVIGAVFMGVLSNGMDIIGVDQNWKNAIKGAVLLAAVVFDVISQKRRQSA
ncbi:sugar ABC transporter permease [Clostridia bacterium]|nr:sugar ABC transporter permease [Clostridia bacterium]